MAQRGPAQQCNGNKFVRRRADAPNECKSGTHAKVLKLMSQDRKEGGRTG
jgi:hypothetical protein